MVKLSSTASQEKRPTPLGVKVNVVEPRYFRTEFLATSSLEASERKTDGYEAIAEMTEAHRGMHGTPARRSGEGRRSDYLARVSGQGPLHQLIGSDAYAYATAKIDALTADVAAGRALALTIDHAA